MSERFDILHLVAPGAVGGIESVIRLLATGQLRRGHRVRVLATIESRDAAAPFLDALGAAGVEVIPLVAPGRSYLREWRAVTRLCRADRPAIAHTHGYRADVIGGSAARRAGVPTVTTVHGFTGGDWKNRLYERLQRVMYRRFDAVAPVSAPMAEALERSKVSRDSLHLVPNAYEPAPPMTRDEARRRLGIGDRAFRIGWIGRATYEKGLDVAVRALAHPSAAGSVLSVIGDGVERPRAMALASALGVVDRIDWHGLVPDAGRLVTAFDALLLSSRTEGTPIVLFEAMAACVPIIATLVGGVPDVVGHTDAALVPPGDPGAIAGAVQSMRTDADAASRRAASARRRLERDFAVEPWLDRYDRVYQAASERRRAAA